MTLGVGITDGKLLFYHGILEGNMDKHFSTIEYNNRTSYYCFNNFFPDNFGIPALNLTPITIDDIPHLHKRARHIPQIFFRQLSLLPPKTMVVLWSPLLILHNSFSYLIIILTLANKKNKYLVLSWQGEKKILL